jgi:methyltransferase (TIGR00027 family)
MIENISGIARTAWYCCGVRWADAQGRAPICGDRFAELFMDDEAQAVFAHFADLRLPNICSATRARIIDDWLRDRLLADPEQLVILLGAGFDARAFRLPGGRWVEFDQPGLIAQKDRLLPAHRAPQPLTRVAIDFATERLADRLQALEGENPIIVMEGVSMYLSQAQMTSTLSALGWAFPRHTLMMDLMTKRFATRHGGEVRKRLAEMGGHFASDLTDDPARHVSQQGYRLLARSSMLARARELRALPLPKFLLDTLLRPLRDGYCAYVFEAGSGR